MYQILYNYRFSYFEKLKGSESPWTWEQDGINWKKYRNEIFARMEQLGAFNFFFTLSSAEMKWPEVLTSVLHTLGNSIIYESGWEEDESKIKIKLDDDEEITLEEFKKTKLTNKSKFFKQHFLLITRIFDNKVKAFIKLMTGSGEVEYWTYRIEFQIRGMPHVHGVFWLRKEIC